MKIIARDIPPRAAWALEQAGVHPLLARLYAARGVRAKDELDDGLGRLLPPSGLKGIDAAARLLADAMAQNKRLCIVADYDCDGATACADLLAHLQQHGQGTLTLCGERSAQRFEARPRSLGSKISSLFGRLRPSTVLEKL